MWRQYLHLIPNPPNTLDEKGGPLKREGFPSASLNHKHTASGWGSQQPVERVRGNTQIASPRGSSALVSRMWRGRGSHHQPAQHHCQDTTKGQPTRHCIAHRLDRAHWVPKETPSGTNAGDQSLNQAWFFCFVLCCFPQQIGQPHQCSRFPPLFG